MKKCGDGCSCKFPLELESCVENNGYKYKFSYCKDCKKNIDLGDCRCIKDEEE